MPNNKATKSLIHTNPTVARLLLALDVVHQLATNPMFIAVTGHEFTGELAYEARSKQYGEQTQTAQEFIRANIEKMQCQVCAKGALTVAHVMRFNELGFGQLEEAVIKRRNQLPEFPPAMLDEIEFLFEGTIYGRMAGFYSDTFPGHEVIEAYRAEQKFEGMDARARLLKIMSLLIGNGGSFVLLPPKFKRDRRGRFARK